MRKKALRVRVAQCATCPFRESGWTSVRPLLEGRALTVGSPICHSTGPKALKRTRQREPLICRGARDLQLRVLHAVGFLDAPTDEAWARRAAELENPA